MVQTRGQQVGDHNAPQKGGSTPSKQMECGFAAGDVGAPIYTQTQENMTTKAATTRGYYIWLRVHKRVRASARLLLSQAKVF